MKYCTRCLYPETKPDIFFNDEGLCSACIAFDARSAIDWTKRETEFVELARHASRNATNPDYDCIIPVSGGKDSHAQIIKAVSYGLKPLAVCATTCHLSPLGRKNLDNISNLCDLVEITVKRAPRKRINKYALEVVGDISWPEHQLIFTVPFNVAEERSISLILWGENPQNEYGGPRLKHETNLLDKSWLSEFGGLNGLRLGDLTDAKIISEQDANSYRRLDSGWEVKSLYTGYYFPWDGAENAATALQYGFRTYNKPVEGIGYDYENLDNLQTGIHDYFKYLKFGFGRCTDLVCNHIRRKRITRAEGIEIVNTFDGAYPSTYLEVSLEVILANIDMKIEDFLPICDKFTNKKLFSLPPRGSRRLRPVPLFTVGGSYEGASTENMQGDGLR